MRFKMSIAVCYLLFGSVAATWQSYQTNFDYRLADYDSGMGASAFTEEEQKFGFVSRVKLCKNSWYSMIEWDLANICEPSSIMKKDIKTGDDGRFSPGDCSEVKL